MSIFFTLKKAIVHVAKQDSDQNHETEGEHENTQMKDLVYIKNYARY